MTANAESWKPVVGYESFYEVSNLGRVRSLERDVWNGQSFYRKAGRIRKPVFNRSNGYMMMFLCGDSGKTCVYVHRIVAMAFVGGYQPGLVVNHKNEVKTDNKAANLEWCTSKYNNQYNGKAQICSKPIEQIEWNGQVVRTWTSARAASQALNIEYKNISACCLNKRRSAGGFRWRFVYGQSNCNHGGKRIRKDNVDGASSF